MTEILLDNVSYTYSPGTPFESDAVENVTMRFEGGKTTGIIGHTGSGKSTVAQMLNALIRPTSGRVLLDGHDIWEDEKHIKNVRYKVGLVFQYPEYQLFEETVGDDIAFGPKNIGLDDDEIKKRVREAAYFTGIDDDILSRSPFELSGGQKRRVAIAGVMAMNPDVMVLDEPAAGLDPRGRREILGGLMEYRKSKNNSLVIISHSMEDMALYSDYLYVLSNGKLEMQGTAKDIFSKADELEKMGLSVPQVTNITSNLRSRGYDIPSGIYTVSDAKDAILSLYRKKAK